MVNFALFQIYIRTIMKMKFRWICEANEGIIIICAKIGILVHAIVNIYEKYDVHVLRILF